MKYAIRLLEDELKELMAARKEAIELDSYKKVIDIENKINQIEYAIIKLLKR